MERGFALTDHPSDIAISATGASLREAFEEAAGGLTAIITDPALILTREERVIAIDGADTTHLLVRWLSELLYLYDAGGFIGRNFVVDSLTTTSLRARVRGELLDPARHHPRLDVKAITYHKITVTERPDGATLTVVLDI